PDDAAELRRQFALHREPAASGGVPPTLPPDGSSVLGTLPQSAGEAAANGAAAVPGFIVLGELGRGGMGIVYKARQVALNRVVALKMILAGGHSSPEQRERFAAEAQAVAALHHPGVVQVYEYGTHQGLPYFALELCPGGSLAAKLAAGPL